MPNLYDRTPPEWAQALTTLVRGTTNQLQALAGQASGGSIPIEALRALRREIEAFEAQLAAIVAASNASVIAAVRTRIGDPQFDVVAKVAALRDRRDAIAAALPTSLDGVNVTGANVTVPTAQLTALGAAVTAFVNEAKS